LPKKRAPQAKGPAGRLPSKAEILDYLKEHPGDRDKRHLARAFGLRGQSRVALRDLLREMRQEGLIEGRTGRRTSEAGQLPPVTVLEVIALDSDGEVLARPATWEHEAPPPTIRLAAGPTRGQAPAPGELVLARLTRERDGDYSAQIIRRLQRQVQQLLGLYELGDEGGRLRPCDKKSRKDFALAPADAADAVPGDLVLAELLPQRRGRHFGLQSVRVIERLGDLNAPAALSLIAIHEHGLPQAFPAAAEAQAEAAEAAGPKGRKDLRHLPLITIDGADARDFDDAVFAAPDQDTDNPGGYHVVVAIADVAHYVRPGSALDREAKLRGNSAYFPDRVVPMLPEALSNGWCSLVPQEDRPCLAVEMWLDGEGAKRRHRFCRAIMRSRARLTYNQVQALNDGEDAAPEVEADVGEVIGSLYGAFACLSAARKQRGTLDLDLPERQVLLDEQGGVADIVVRERQDSHRLIEELMIAANVAAAEELERLRQPCMYRIHEPPDPEKLASLGEVLRSLGLSLPRGQVIRPGQLTALLHKVAGRPEADLVNEMVLRSQSQAVYGPENRGHFGLALRRYAHFTSPIRRYADLLVHRALITGLGLGKDGLGPQDAEAFAEIAVEISACERRAVLAERDTIDRFCAAFLANRVGHIVKGRIRGVTKFGLFVALDHSGADGLLLARDLVDDYYKFDPNAQALVGQRWGRSYRLGARLAVRIAEATPLTGAIRLELPDETDDERATTTGGEAPDAAGWHPIATSVETPPKPRTSRRRRTVRKSGKRNKS
jgi:ribonuclease R